MDSSKGTAEILSKMQKAIEATIVKSMRPLAMTCEQYVSLWNELDLEEIYDFLEIDADKCLKYELAPLTQNEGDAFDYSSIDLYNDIMVFVYQLDEAIERQPLVANFDLNFTLADTLSCLHYKTSPIFTEHLYRILNWEHGLMAKEFKTKNNEKLQKLRNKKIKTSALQMMAMASKLKKHETTKPT